MSKAQRRAQLLQVAESIILEEGTDALTLARVAERAGVTKPIAYEHFGTRSGLLSAMYRDYDERVTEGLREALKTDGRTIEDVAEILAAAYVHCAVSAGPVVGAITAALAATEEMEELLQACRDSFGQECLVAFAPFVDIPPERRPAIVVGIIGAAEALSQAAAEGRLPPEAATAALARMMIGVLPSTPPAPRR
ncbi:MAG: TetR/AcrR family transcriptional regulator [Fimbriimonas sp.]